MKTWPVLFFVFAASAAASAADNVPVPPQGAVDFQGRTQLVMNLGPVDLLAEALGRSVQVDPALRSYESLTLGGYYRVMPNLKVGAFYRLQAGAIHDDDWVPNPSATPAWIWQDTSTRLEQVLMLDVSPRFQLGFLPGESWVLMVKGRYIYNTANGQQSIMARPELTWFWIQDRVPILNASLSYEMYFPLNFGSTPLYEGYPYLDLLWHATPDIALELGGAYVTTVWSASRSELSQDGAAYSVPASAWVVSLGVVITLAF
jgi:hypothetical protein